MFFFVESLLHEPLIGGGPEVLVGEQKLQTKGCLFKREGVPPRKTLCHYAPRIHKRGSSCRRRELS